MEGWSGLSRGGDVGRPVDQIRMGCCHHWAGGGEGAIAGSSMVVGCGEVAYLFVVVPVGFHLEFQYVQI
jgi:hypothetical protein